MNNNPNQKKNPAVLGIISIAVLGTLMAGTVALKARSDNATTQGTSVSSTTQTPNPSASNTNATTGQAASSTSGFKDGTYSATGSYLSPGGNESIAISITLSNGKVTDTSASARSNSRESKAYMSDFITSYKSLIVGKDVGSISLSRVSGASLTTGGFNDALDQIKNQARS